MKSTSRHTCCSQGAGGKCDPNHPHHVGNGKADELATEGLSMAEPSRDMAMASTTGEERHHLVDHTGQPCQGSVSDALKEAATAMRLKLMADGTPSVAPSKKATQWIQQMNTSMPEVRKWLCRRKIGAPK